jgi:guanosine-3',5'-bis(diphosphate) 3'-pyrophosphohydrolase
MSKLAAHSLWQQAVSFAARRHAGQVRKDGVTPYEAHPFRVAFTVRHVFEVEDPLALCAALLHDTIEDTTADYDELAEEFGNEIARAVASLTKDKRLPERARERAFFDQLAAASWQVRLVKLADAYDNLCDAERSGIALRKTLRKAQRTCKLARGDKRLKHAARLLEQLIVQLRKK